MTPKHDSPGVVAASLGFAVVCLLLALGIRWLSVDIFFLPMFAALAGIFYYDGSRMFSAAKIACSVVPVCAAVSWLAWMAGRSQLHALIAVPVYLLMLLFGLWIKGCIVRHGKRDTGIASDSAP